jgi:hypothetical protein
VGLTIKSIAQFANDLQQGVISLTDAFTDWTSGSPELALTQSFSRAFGFLQNQALAIIAFARAGTSFNADLDSYVADYVPFGFTPRLPATSDTGPATFTRNNTTNQAILAFGTIIQNPTPSPSSAIAYQVIPDSTNSASSVLAGGYICAAGVATQSATVQAVLNSDGTAQGTASHVIAGTLTVIASPGVPFDYVTNPNAIQNGQNQETDIALRARFAKWMTGLGGGTTAVTGSQILSVQVGITYTINGGLNASGAAQVPCFTAVCDDGSGAIPSGTITAIAAAIDAKRTPGMPRFVIAPTNVALTITVTGTQIQAATNPATGLPFDPATVRNALQTAIIAFVEANGVGGANASNNYTPALKFAYVPLVNLIGSFIGIGAGQGLSGYGAVTLDGGTSDVALTTYQLATASTGTVTIS